MRVLKLSPELGGDSPDRSEPIALLLTLRPRWPWHRSPGDLDLAPFEYLFGVANVEAIRARHASRRSERLAHRSFQALLREGAEELGPFRATLQNFLEVLDCPIGTVWEFHECAISGEPYLTLEGAYGFGSDRYDVPCLPKGRGLVWEVMNRPDKIRFRSNVDRDDIENQGAYEYYQGKEILLLRLETSSKVYGALCLARDRPFDMTSVETVLEMFEKVAALEIHNKVLEQKAMLLERVAAIVPTAHSTLEASARSIAESTREVVGALAVSIFLKPQLDPKARVLTLAAASTDESEIASDELVAFRERGAKIEYNLGLRALTSRVCQRGEPIVCNRVQAHPENSHTFREIKARQTDSWIGVPIVDGRRNVVGVIRCTEKVRDGDGPRQPYIFDDFDVFALRHVADVTATIFQTISTIAQLDALNRSLKLAERIREHEMRAPLASITGNASFVSRYLDDASATSKHRRLEEIISDAQMCAFLLHETRVPDPAEFQDGLTMVSVNSVIAELAQFLKRAVRQRSPIREGYEQGSNGEEELPVDDFMSIRSEGSAPRALLNKHLLQRALYNLGVNAIKYGRPGGVLAIRVVEASASDRDLIVIEFEDSGIGIPESETDRIFRIGYRGSNVLAISGEGLGLSIAREIALAHDGDLLVVSANKPTLFRMVLPIRKLEPGADRGHQGGQVRRFDAPRRRRRRRRR